MAQTHDLGPFFFHFGKFISLDDTHIPLLGRLPSQEIEPPFRNSQAFFARLPIVNIGVVFGKWRATGLDEEAALLAATSGYGLDVYDDVDLTDPDVRAAVRANIAAKVEDWDEEWEVINAFGVVE